MEKKSRKVVSIPPEMWDSLAALAAVKGTSTAGLVRKILADYLVENEFGVKSAKKFVADYQQLLFTYRESEKEE